MDNLIKKFNEDLSTLSLHIARAEHVLSNEAIKHNEPTENQLIGWRKFTDKFIETKNQLKNLINTGFDHNKKAIDIHLDFFRSIARYFDEIACVWSTEYDTIANRTNTVYVDILKLDEKYQMGEYQNLT